MIYLKGPVEAHIPCDLPPDYEPTWVFDQDHRPIRVLRRTDGGLMVAPPPGEVRELYLKREGEQRSVVTRALDYVASVEALDVNVKRLLVSRGSDLSPPSSSSPSPSLDPPLDREGFALVVVASLREVWGEGSGVQVEACAEHTPLSLWVEDDQGFCWGPLTLYPYDKPVRWPFPGQLGEVIIEPLSGGRVTVRKGPFEMVGLSWAEAHRLALLVRSTGFELAVEAVFPHGVRLGHASPS